VFCFIKGCGEGLAVGHPPGGSRPRQRWRPRINVTVDDAGDLLPAPAVRARIVSSSPPPPRSFSR
jgi:hypothetical protein